MKRTVAWGAILTAAVTTSMFVTGCQTVRQVTDALTNLQKLQFKLGDVDGFQVSGIDISRLSQPSQIGAGDMIRLGSNLASKKLPVAFTLNVLARNPNTGGSATPSAPIALTRLDWTLLIDDRTTINGIVDRRLEIPASGETISIPFTVQLDLYKFFADKGLDDLLNLAFAVGGAQGSSSRLKLSTKVRVQVFGSEFWYPGELVVVNHQFTNP